MTTAVAAAAAAAAAAARAEARQQMVRSEPFVNVMKAGGGRIWVDRGGGGQRRGCAGGVSTHLKNIPCNSVFLVACDS
jgi:hypothetical protein